MPQDEHGGMTSKRILSIDVFRGFMMCMITIGSGEIGGGSLFRGLHKLFDSPVTEFLQGQMTRGSWGDIHFYTFVNSLFLFIVGVAIPLSLHKRLQQGYSKKEIYIHVIKRMILLYVLGLIAGGHILSFDLSKLYLRSNILQDIGVSYFIVSLMVLNLRLKWQIITAAGLLMLYWALMMLIPVPGYGAGVLTPEGNLGTYVDNIILGPFQPAWNVTWVLVFITIPCTVLMGRIAGYILCMDKSGKEKVMRLSLTGAGCMVAGLIWGIWFPVIWEIWTSSWVLFSGGVCFLLLAFFYSVVDVLGFRRWSFIFQVIGMNSIAAYMAAHLYDFRNIGNIFVGGISNFIGRGDELLQAVAGFTVLWLILYWMYQKKSFVKV